MLWGWVAQGVLFKQWNFAATYLPAVPFLSPMEYRFGPAFASGHCTVWAG